MLVAGTVNTKTRPPGRTSRRPSASHSSGANVARDTAASNPRRRRGRQLIGYLLAAMSLERDAVRDLQLANRGSEKRGLLGDWLAEAYHQTGAKQRQRQRGKAASAPHVDQSSGAVEPLREGKGVGIVFCHHGPDRFCAGQVDALVPADQKIGELEQRGRLPGVSVKAPFGGK